MLDRLIELLEKADETVVGFSIDGDIGVLADYLLENGVIVPPCKMGDTVYRVVTMGTGVTFKKVGYNIYREREQTIKRFIRCVEVTKNNFFDICENFSKTVFLTEEEAEEALAKMKGGTE